MMKWDREWEFMTIGYCTSSEYPVYSNQWHDQGYQISQKPLRLIPAKVFSRKGSSRYWMTEVQFTIFKKEVIQ